MKSGFSRHFYVCIIFISVAGAIWVVDIPICIVLTTVFTYSVFPRPIYAQKNEVLQF